MSNYRSRYSWRLKFKPGRKYRKRLKPRLRFMSCRDSYRIPDYYRFHYWYQLSDYRVPVLYHPIETNGSID